MYRSPVNGKLFYKEGDFLIFKKMYLINTVLSAAPQIQLCRRMLRTNLGLLRLWHWQPDGLPTWLDFNLYITVPY
jgi:hypothetical protein